MRLGWYIARTYVASIFLSLVLLVMTVLSVTLIENVGSMARIENGATIALQLAMFQAIEFAYQVLPITAFLGALVTGALLGRSGELLAMQAAGLGPIRILMPCFLVTLGVCALGLVGAEWGVPWGLKEAEKTRMRYTQSQSALTRFYNRRTHWFRHENLVLYLPFADTKTGVFRKPSIYDMRDGKIREVIEAESLEEIEGAWLLRDVVIYRSEGIPFEKRDELALNMRVSTRDLTDVTGNPRLVSRSELLALIERRTQAGFDSTLHQLEFHHRFSFPLLALWLFLLAAPWVIDPGRRRSMAVSLGVGVVAVAITLSATQVFRLLALGRKIDVELGAWGVALTCFVVLPFSWMAQRRKRTRGAVF